MHIFSKHCYCRSRMVPFRSEDRFDEHAVGNVFCPACSERAPAEGFTVAVAGIPGWSGTYAIDWNQSFLEEKDPAFKDAEGYYARLFASGGVTFGFLPKRHPERFAAVLGVKGHLPSEVLPRGRAGRIIAAEEVQAPPRKRTGRGSRAAKRRPRGYHR